MFERTFFITAVCFGRKPVFRSTQLAGLFLNTMYGYRKQGKFLLHEFVVMPDHIHLILTPDIKIPLERGVQFIKGGFSHRCSKELALNSEIWQRGFTNHRIRDLEDYGRHTEYIHMNPVRAKLAASAADYPYSSARPGFELDAVPTTAKAGSS
jgi:REP-associated tyrosine transposase